MKREEFVEPAVAAEAEAEEALVDVEADETEDAAAGEADETFLEEEEEDGGDVSTHYRPGRGRRGALIGAPATQAEISRRVTGTLRRPSSAANLRLEVSWRSA